MLRGTLASSLFFSLLRRGTLLAAALLLGSTVQGCGETQIKISIIDGTDPKGNSLRDQSRWAEFNIFKGKCPDKVSLAEGTFAAPFRQQIVVDQENEAFKTGKLATDVYGFAVLLRREEDCGIVAYGCAKADLKTVREVNIKLNPTYINSETEELDPRGCRNSATCEEGVCVGGEEDPPPDDENPPPEDGEV